MIDLVLELQVVNGEGASVGLLLNLDSLRYEDRVLRR